MGALGAFLADPTEATRSARRGKRRRRQIQRPNLRSLDSISFDRFELPQGDDPYADRGFSRVSRPDYSSSSDSSSGTGSYSSNDLGLSNSHGNSNSHSSGHSSGSSFKNRSDNTPRSEDDYVCIEEPEPICDTQEDCIAEMQKEEKCVCDCNEEPPPKCDLDIVLLIDVCSCSIDVWNGVKSYADALISKYQQEIGISADEARVSLVQFSQSTKNVISFSDSYAEIINAIENDMTMDDFVAQGMYITNGLKAVKKDLANARPGSTRVLVTVTDGYTHPSIEASDVQALLDDLGDDIQLHAISRSEFRRDDECNFASQARTSVCQRRAAVLKMLNGGKDDVFMYSDAESTHDVIEAGKEACPPPPTKALHCECECPLPIGCQGEVGDGGIRGPVGDKGDIGETGKDGEDGEQGKDGIQGPKGEKGPDGSPGFNGPPGEPGINGQPGHHGDRGNQGPQGDKGIKGPPGQSGPTGPNGKRGNPGPEGGVGNVGMPGAPGPVGKPLTVNMRTIKDQVFAILDELKPGGARSGKMAKLTNSRP